MSHDVYISYARDDIDIVRELTSSLRNEGLYVWFDEEEIRPGEDWLSEVSYGIKNSKNVIVILSDNSGKSRWLRSEAAFALAESDKIVIPILLSANADIPFILRNLQSIDFSDSNLYQKNVRRLVKALKSEKETLLEDDNDALYKFTEYENQALKQEQQELKEEYQNKNTKLVRRVFALTLGAVVFSSLYLLILLANESPGVLNYNFQLVTIGIAIGLVPSIIQLIATAVSKRGSKNKEMRK